MLPATVIEHFELPSGADWRVVILQQAADRVTPIDLSGCTARLQVRRSACDPAAAITLSTEPGGGLSLVAAEGRLDVHLPAAWSDGLRGRYVYALELYWPGGTVQRVMEGRLKFSPRVVRST